jgi:hypothetical protein
MSILTRDTRSLALLIFSLLLTACSSAPKVGTDYDPAFNFASIKSYYLVENNSSANPDGPGSGLVDQRATRALQAEMQKRGIPAVSADKADIILTFHIVTQDRTKVTSYNNGYAYRPYGYGGGYYGAGNQIDVRQYTQGTLLVDLIDPKDKRIVWRGQASAIVKDRSNEEREALMNSYVEAIFAHMPPPLGSKQ